jgi:putative ABC transport system substrate-binding protein
LLKRRTLLYGAAAWPLQARAQPSSRRRNAVIGFVGIASTAADAVLFNPFRRRLAELGYVEGTTLRFEVRSSNGEFELAQRQFAELIALPVDLFLSPGPAATRTLAHITRIPVVAIGLPSLQSMPGIYDSLARPGGNVTGFSAFGEEMSAKRIELLRETLPGVKSVGVMHNATDPTFSAWGQETMADLRRQGLDPVAMELKAPTKEAVRASYDQLRERNGRAVIVVRDFMTAKLAEEIIGIGLAGGIAVVGAQSEFAETGALFSYGPDIVDLARRSADYADRILKGEKAADLPIQLPTKFDLVVNLATAKRLGLTVPPIMLARADRVID